MPEPAKYYQRLVAAMIRGMLQKQYPEHLLFKKHVADLTEEDFEVLMQLGKHHQLPLSAFQRLEVLPETIKILDIIRSVSPDNLLDVGCGRGAFIWRLLDEYRNMSITAVDSNEDRISTVAAVAKGGIGNIVAQKADVTTLKTFPKLGFDITTALRVLEYVEDIEAAVAELCRVTRRFIIVQYPISESANPDRKNALGQEELKKLFEAQEVMQVKIEVASNYYILVIRK